MTRPNFLKVRTVILLSILIGVIIVAFSSQDDWRTASRKSAGIAPDPQITHEAILHVYGADAWGWRGLLAIHTWIAAKRTGEDYYTVYDVVGWRSYRGHQVMRVARDIPDRHWYGERPRILKEHRGPHVDKLIDAIEKAAEDYPWKDTYSAFPGPNSNTFTAWIAKQVPALELDLPCTAIGSSYAD